MALSKKFKWKALTSLVLAWSFIIVSLSGIALYIGPPGRIARLTEWTFLFLSKGQWWDLHRTSMFIVVIAAIFHLISFNWKIFVTYFWKRIKGSVRRPVEMLVAFILFLLLMFGTLYKWPGVYSVIDLGDEIREYHINKYQENVQKKKIVKPDNDG